MHQRMGRFAALGGATALVVSTLGFGGASASATPVGAVPFSQAVFNGFATGDELHLGIGGALSSVVGATGVPLLSLDQALSSASTSTAGLTSTLATEPWCAGCAGTVIQPAQAASVKAFNLGSGLNLDLGQIGSNVTGLLSQVKSIVPLLQSISIAPPDLPAAIGQLLDIPLDPILHATVLPSEAQAAWPGTSCPTGNLSYGLGRLASASVLSGLPAITTAGVSTQPLLSTAGTDGLQGVAQTKSLTDLVSNGDGSYGIQTQAQDIIAPISLNLLGLAQLNIGVHAANGNLDPVTLTATTSGEKSVPASLKLSTDDILDVTVSALGQTVSLAHVPLSTIGAQGLHIQLTLPAIVDALTNLDVPSIITSTLQQVISGLSQISGTSQITGALQGVVGQLNPLLGQVGSQVSSVVNTLVNQPLASNLPSVSDLLKLLDGVVHLSLGTLDVDTFPHAIGGAWNSAPVQSADGTQASGALDLLNLNLSTAGSFIDLGNLGAAGGLLSQLIPAGTIPNVTQALNIPAIPNIALPNLQIANPVLGHLESAAAQQSPIACTVSQTTSTPNPQQQSTPTPGPAPAPHVAAPALPFTGGPGGFWQPVTGVALLGLGGGSLALLRRLRRRSGV